MVDDITNYPESKCLLKHIKERIKSKKGIILFFTGETGEGKSYGGLRLLELWYKEWFNEDFPITHVCNTLEEAIILVKDFKRIGEGIMVEELSVHVGSREALTPSNILFNKFVDIARIKQSVIIGNMPHISFVDKHLQMMAQSWVNCQKVDFKREIVIARPLWLQTSPHKKEPYKHKYISDEGEEIDKCYFKLAKKELLESYDDLKNKSNDNIFNEIILKLRNDRIKQLKKLGQKTLSKREEQAYTLTLDGYSAKECAEKMGIKSIDNYYKYMSNAKKKLEKPEYSLYTKILKENDKKTTKNEGGRH